VGVEKIDPARDFELLTEKFKGKTPLRYRMPGSFKADDVLDHNKFVIGFVISVSHDYLDVVFSDKARLLA
jgi:hypothetical protein